MKLTVKNVEDCYAGALFLVIGLLTMWGSTSYKMGTAARMGPGYFPYWLGGIMAVLGVIILVKSIGMSSEKPKWEYPKALFILGFMLLVALITGYSGLGPNGALSTGVLGGCVLAFWIYPKIALILGPVVIFAIFLKSLGLIFCAVLLIILSSLASPDYKLRQTIISAIVLAVGAWAIFVVGLKQQIPVWPDTEELARTFTIAEKK